MFVDLPHLLAATIGLDRNARSCSSKRANHASNSDSGFDLMDSAYRLVHVLALFRFQLQR